MKAILTRAGAVLVGLVLGAAAIYALLPRPRAREDRDQLAMARAGCQVLLIGPSYANMVVPKSFDQEARQIGLGRRLCKLGRAGLAGYELAQEVDFALSKPWPKLELVLVDVTLGRASSFPEGNWFKSRTVEWHGLAGVKWTSAYYRDNPDKSPRPRVWLSHVEHFLAHYVSLGRAPELFGWREPRKVLVAQRTGKARPPKGKKDKAPERAGSSQGRKRRDAGARVDDAKVDGAKDASAAKRKKGKGKGKGKSNRKPEQNTDDARARGPSKKEAKRLAATARLVAWNQAHARNPQYGESAWLQDLRALVRRRGYEAFFVIAPVWYHPRLPADAVRKKDGLTVLRFNDPERFPELYVPEARGKTHHLSGLGRPVYSRAMARELFAHWKGP